MITNDIRKHLTVLAGALALAGSGAVAAQGQGGYGQQGQQGQQAPAQQAPQGADDFSDEELQSFAEAQQEVSAISKDFEGKIQDTEDPAKMAEMRQKANQKMVEAVQNAGLEPAKYNAIANAVRADPELAEKIEGMQ